MESIQYPKNPCVFHATQKDPFWLKFQTQKNPWDPPPSVKYVSGVPSTEFIDKAYLCCQLVYVNLTNVHSTLTFVFKNTLRTFETEILKIFKNIQHQPPNYTVLMKKEGFFYSVLIVKQPYVCAFSGSRCKK